MTLKIVTINNSSSSIISLSLRRQRRRKGLLTVPLSVMCRYTLPLVDHSRLSASLSTAYRPVGKPRGRMVVRLRLWRGAF
jgi:hypothetical protein